MSESPSQALFSLAGFQMTIIGRFWVTAEDNCVFGGCIADMFAPLLYHHHTVSNVAPMLRLDARACDSSYRCATDTKWRVLSATILQQVIHRMTDIRLHRYCLYINEGMKCPRSLYLSQC